MPRGVHERFVPVPEVGQVILEPRVAQLPNLSGSSKKNVF